MKQTVVHLHLVSETVGDSLGLARRAASSLLPDASIVEHIHPPLISRALLGGALKNIERHPGIVLYNLTDPVAIRRLREGCAAVGSRTIAMPLPASGAQSIVPDNVVSSAMRLHLGPKANSWYRTAAAIFAGVLAIGAIWELAVALLHPIVAFPPPSALAAQADAKQINAAYNAAWIGAIRGELWADYAFSLASGPIQAIDAGASVTTLRSIDLARRAARRAAELSPHDSRVWLLLAVLDSQIDQRRASVSNELENSYYTGPNEDTLRRLRIGIALGSNAINSPELQTLVTRELRAMVASDPESKPSIVKAYERASSEGRHTLESAIADLDPELVATLHKITPVK
jgi:hypothetical protein